LATLTDSTSSQTVAAPDAVTLRTRSRPRRAIDRQVGIGLSAVFAPAQNTPELFGF
jgi:hypothetical protein